MATKTIYKNGYEDITVPATESIAISNYGGGIAKIFYLIEDPNRPQSFQLQQTLENNGVVLGAFTNETIVKIEANNSTVIYDVGTAPDTGIGNADSLGGIAAANYWHTGNDGPGSGLDADTVDGIQASVIAKTNTGQTFSGINNFTNYLNVQGNGYLTVKSDLESATIRFWDADIGTFRNITWDDTNDDWYLEDSGSVMRKIWHAGDNASLGDGNGVSGTFTTSDAKTVTVTNGIITSIV